MEMVKNGVFGGVEGCEDRETRRPPCEIKGESGMVEKRVQVASLKLGGR